MTTPFPFVAGQVLTAAQLNSISELPTRTLTATGNAVAADRYSRVILNGSSISYTVNSATFDVGEVVHLYNINSTAATIAAGTGGVTINAAAGLTLAQYQAATLYAVSSTSFILWKTDVTQTAAGLELITSQTIGSAVSSVTVSSAFSSTYANYFITVSGGVSSGLCALQLQLGSQTSGYYGGLLQVAYNGGAVTGIGDNNAAQLSYVGWASTNAMAAQIIVNSPNLASITTVWAGGYMAGTTTGTYQGQDNATTQHTSFVIKPSAGTLTGGTIKVYGFKN